MRSFVRLVASSFVAAAVVVVGIGPIGCGDGGDSGTTGRRVALDVTISASADSTQFTNGKGWTVSLTKAAISTGALYFYDGEPLFAGGPRPGRAPLSLVKSAFAHPGHYGPGNAKGELLAPSSADLLAGGTLGRGHGVTGVLRSATFTFGVPPAGPLAAELGASVIVLEGAAAKDGATRAFRAEIAAEEMSGAKGTPQVEGCPFIPAELEGDGTVTVTVKLPMWFDQVDFTDVPSSPDARPVLMADGLARNQLVRGAKGGLGYLFSFAPR